MRVPLTWLADYVALELPVDDLAHRLTMSGLKVEAIDRIGEGWEDIYVGLIAHIEPHPTSRNPLSIATVDLGDRTVTVVTGAPNVRQGDKVPIVLAGGRIPHGPDGKPMLIETRAMPGGLTSEGMLASGRELGISDDHSGILILPPDAPLGAPLYGVAADDVLDIETNPNRPDTLSIVGIAREVAAVTGQQFTLPDLRTLSTQPEWTGQDSIRVDVEAPDLCPRYSALRIGGLLAGPSPFWMQTRLQAAGMRPINLIVDITNYVMLEYGQPMHAFDSSRISGDRIVVRRATPGERIHTLDGAERTLGPENLVIADGDRAVAVAGVMGGENSEVDDATIEIVLESANFDPVSVRRTAKQLSLRTEASARFEKGLPPEQTTVGLQRYLQLLADISPDPLRVGNVSDAWVGPEPERRVGMPMRDLHRLTGVEIPVEAAGEALSLLGFDIEVRDEGVTATVPYWRRADVTMSADLVEEVARMVGFDEIPTTLPLRTMPPAQALPELNWEAAVREELLAIGLTECVTHSLTSPESMIRLRETSTSADAGPETWAELIANPAGVFAREAHAAPVAVANPATRDRRVVRLTLLPSLLDVVARNFKNGDEALAFFEIARTFFWRSETSLPYERRTLAVCLAGTRQSRSWQDADPGPYSFFDLKGTVAAVLEALRVSGWTVASGAHPSLHPGRSAVLRLAGSDVGFFGELHPGVAAAFDLEDRRVQVAEIDLDSVFELASDTPAYRPLPRYPAVYRDIAVIVDRETAADDVLRVVRDAGGELLESTRIFDVYQGAQLPEGKKSIAVGMSFRAPGATLTQDDVSEVVTRIVAALGTQLDAGIRE